MWHSICPSLIRLSLRTNFVYGLNWWVNNFFFCIQICFYFLILPLIFQIWSRKHTRRIKFHQILHFSYSCICHWFYNHVQILFSVLIWYFIIKLLRLGCFHFQLLICYYFKFLIRDVQFFVFWGYHFVMLHFLIFPLIFCKLWFDNTFEFLWLLCVCQFCEGFFWWLWIELLRHFHNLLHGGIGCFFRPCESSWL